MLPPVDELKLTKKRLRNLRARRLGLQQLAVRVISKQLTFYRTNPDELEKLKNLPGILREKILQVLMKKRCLDAQGQEMEFENLKKIFPLLLSARTHFIELNGILSFCPDRYKDGKIEKVTQWCVELLKQIETRAPHVETLVIKRNNPFFTGGRVHPFVERDAFNQEMLQSLMKLQKLNRLQVNLYCFHVGDLLKICKDLSKLEYINVGLFHQREKDQPAPEDVSSSFCNLKELIFKSPDYENDWLGSLCTRNLPNIEVLQYDPNQITEWIGKRRDIDRYRALHFLGASNLRNICVDLTQDIMFWQPRKLRDLFPKVTCLMVKNIVISSALEDNEWTNFDVRQLELLNPYNSQIAEPYLISYGPNLQSLYLGHDNKNLKIDLELIFKCCPKLEKLSLLNMFLETPSSKMEFFAELKELEWLFNYYEDTADGISDQEGKGLSNILSAPKLEKVKLQAKIINEYDLMILCYLVQAKRILKNLTNLHVILNSSITETLANFLKNACTFLPKLTDFKFGYRRQFEDPLLTCQLSPLIVSDIDASVIYEMVAVFDNEY